MSIINNELEDAINKMVKVLGDFLRNQNMVNFDNGDDSPNGAMAAMLFKMGQRHNNFEESKILEFEKLLVKKCIEENILEIHIDYNPCAILGEAMDETFGKKGWASMSTFPVKTSIYIDKNNFGVFLKKGYSKPYLEIKD